MDSINLINIIKELELPTNQYAIFGGACLAIRDIRLLKDLDLFVSSELYEQLIKRGWSKTAVGNRKPYLIHKHGDLDIQAFDVRESEGWQPTPKDYISKPEIIDNLPFMPLVELYKWKAVTRRPKDLEDLRLIENYWSKNT